MNSQDFDFVCKLVRERSAVVLDPGKEYLVETRLRPLMRQLQLDTLEALIERLRTQSFNGVHVQVVEAMVTTETSFFRDGHPFTALREQVLPELIRKRGAERGLRFWSAACASGQEPYSLAMLLRSQFPQLADWHVRILGSDLSSEMLSRARQGRFNHVEVNRGLPAELLVKYFQRSGADWQLDPDIGRMVEFRQFNLADTWPAELPLMDVIFLRNVMIYFDVDTKKAILRKIRTLLRPDGYLLLGSAETTLNLDDSFQRVAFDKAGFYQLCPNL